MKYQGYVARIDYDDEDKIFVGRVVGTVDGINFHGQSINELETAFHESVDGYLEACEKLGQKPNKPYSGKILLRVAADAHAAIAAAAEASGKSVNQWAANILKEATR